jgi:hypothetical protein
VPALGLLNAYRRSRGLLIPRIEIVAGRGRRGCALGARAVRPATTAWETFAAGIAFKTGGAVHLRLRAGDEGRQAIDTAGVRDNRLRLGLRLILRLRTMFALTVFAGLMLTRLLVALKGLALARLEVALRVVALSIFALSVFARHERLRMLGNEAGLLAEIGEAFALIFAFVRRRHFVFGARLRLVLPELLLGGCDQPEIMFGVLVIVLCRDRVARGARIARELDVFFRNVGGGAADLDVGSVRFEHPGHRILTAPVIIIFVVAAIIAAVVPVTHPLVIILTVSHVSPLFQP